MKPIDAQFRPKLDFFVAWFLLAIAAVSLAHPWRFDLPWFSKVAWILVVPFIVTFIIYGPILLMRQVWHSGSRGWFVFRIFLSIVIAVAVILGAIRFFGYSSSNSGYAIPMTLSFAAILYLNAKIGRKTG